MTRQQAEEAEIGLKKKLRIRDWEEEERAYSSGAHGNEKEGRGTSRVWWALCTHVAEKLRVAQPVQECWLGFLHNAH